MKKGIGIVFANILLAVVCVVAIAGIPDGFSLRITNVGTNAFSSTSLDNAEGWLESIVLWPDTAGGTFTGIVAISIISTNSASGLSAETMIYSNNAVVARTVIQPRRHVHDAVSGTATNTATIMARYPLTGTDKVVLYAKNAVVASNKNISAHIILED